ncbi:hypothetical protein [Amycolatopsis kentuckyensis]|uniref:hypothetical protein n=1 Tax=Amycolatopsis kentuckyensis TaxID=218823 RepID=UPI00356493F5
MLYIVLVLVLAALGLLVTALITASSLWAWVSIGLSVLAGLILVADWLRRRRRSAAPAQAAAEPEVEAEQAPADEPEPAPAVEKPAEEEQTVLIPAAGDLGGPADTPEPEPAAAVEKPAEADGETGAEGEPGEEETPAADLAVLADLEDEVVVVDEHPRYHLRTCIWLGSRDTIPIGVGEARQLGFTPCDRCSPDATLVAAHR